MERGFLRNGHTELSDKGIFHLILFCQILVMSLSDGQVLGVGQPDGSRALNLVFQCLGLSSD